MLAIIAIYHLHLDRLTPKHPQTSPGFRLPPALAARHQAVFGARSGQARLQENSDEYALAFGVVLSGCQLTCRPTDLLTRVFQGLENHQN